MVLLGSDDAPLGSDDATQVRRCHSAVMVQLGSDGATQL